MKKDELFDEIQKLGMLLNEKQQQQIEDFCDFLISENTKTNLTAIKNKEDIYLKHIYDSLTLIKVLDLTNVKKFLDVGSGAGFPGLVIKICFPETEVTLLEANSKKCVFLKSAIQKLGLAKIYIINERAEEYVKKERETFDFVTTRAVNNMNVISELCLPFLRVNGNFIAMKGNVDDELADAKVAIEILGGHIKEKIAFTLPKENSLRTLVNIEKIKKTPKEYPRKYDRIIKNPLKKNLN